MKNISVIVDRSNSMSCLSKQDIIESVRKTIELQENIDAVYYDWGSTNDGNATIDSLISLIKEQKEKNILILTDGFIDEDKSELQLFLKNNQNIQVLIVGIGADCNLTMCKSFFPPSFIADKRKQYVYSVLELEAALESF